MTTMIMDMNRKALIKSMSEISSNLREGTVTAEQLDGLDELFCTKNFFAWLIFRQEVAEAYPVQEESELRRIHELDPRGSKLWKSLITRGFRRTIADEDTKRRNEILSHYLAIILIPELLCALHGEIASRSRAGTVWGEVEERLGCGIMPYVFDLLEHRSIRLWNPMTSKAGDPQIDLKVRKGLVMAVGRDFRTYCNRRVDAMILSFNSDAVFSCLPPPAEFRTGSKRIGQTAWLQSRRRADAVLTNTDYFIDSAGNFRFDLDLTGVPKPVADKFLVIGLGEEKRRPAIDGADRGSSG